MKRLTAHELQAMMRRGDDVHVVDVLPRESFEKHHLPGSINVPLETEGFADEVRRRTGEDVGFQFRRGQRGPSGGASARRCSRCDRSAEAYGKHEERLAQCG